MDWIQGERFVELANETNIYYRHTHDVNAFFKHLPTKDPFILISHNSDGNVMNGIGRVEDANINLMPSNLKHWFGQNINVVNDRISSLPIGIENNAWCKKDQKKEKMIIMSKLSKQIKRILYINHNVLTNPAQREKPYQLFQDEDWVTAVNGRHGYKFDEYLDNIHNHKFVLCPEGNGIDTHRTWECLYMGGIPIEKRNINNQFYTDLPICFVDDWEEISEDFLIKEFIRIKTKNWNMKKLTFTYWKEKILCQLES